MKLVTVDYFTAIFHVEFIASVLNPFICKLEFIGLAGKFLLRHIVPARIPCGTQLLFQLLLWIEY